MFRKGSFRIVIYALAGWFAGLVFGHALQLAGMKLSPDQQNVCLLTGFLLGLMAYSFAILWRCIGCAGGPVPCEACPRQGRWQRFCNNHRLCAVFLMFWAVGLAFILAHLAGAVFGLAVMESVGHALNWLTWVVAGLTALVSRLFSR